MRSGELQHQRDGVEIVLRRCMVEKAETERNGCMRVKGLNTSFICLLIICCLGLALASQAQSAPQTLSGEIMDDLCAKDKSHEGMMDQMKSMSRDPVTCTKKCVELGAHYVLYDRKKDVVYKIDNQEKAEAFAGKEVRISGTVQKNKLKIDTIEASGTPK
jgi:hypothetical protein